MNKITDINKITDMNKLIVINKFFIIFLLGVLLISSVSATNWYVSKIATGNNSGTSWADAWNELDQINWTLVQPGDVIEIDGGAVECDWPVEITDTNTPKSVSGGDCGMVYTADFQIGKSGTSDAPITIMLSDDPGRDGTVRIFGGVSSPLPFCGSTNFVPRIASGGIKDPGMVLNGRSFIIVDGRKWSGIMIYGHPTSGIFANHWDWRNQYDLVFRNIEVFDNGRTREITEWNINYTAKIRMNTTDGSGVHVVGNRITFDKVIVHDNGQDAFQTCYIGDFNDITIKNSWLYNRRPHPWNNSEVWNYCVHSDGLQMCSNTASQRFTLKDSIVGPGFMQGIFAGAGGDRNSTANNYLFNNTLIVHHHGLSANGAIIIGNGLNNHPSIGTHIDRVTTIRDPYEKWKNVRLFGTGSKIYNSMFYGSVELIAGADTLSSNNYWYNLSAVSKINATKADPMFVDPIFDGTGHNFADFDFTITNPSIPSNVGSTIRKVSDLIGKDLNSGGVFYHPADLNQDGCISLGEISLYVYLWLSGSGVTLSQASDAVNEWLAGC